MCHPDRSSSAAPSGLREQLQRCLGGDSPGAPPGVAEANEDFILEPDLAVDPASGLECDDKVVTIRAGRRLGNPLSDYIDLWMTLERFHERASLTEDGWKCLT